MAAKFRILLGLLCCVMLAALIGLARTGPQHSGDVTGGRSALTNQDCRGCHAAVFAEWEESYHSRAFTDSNVQAAFQHFGYDRQCQTCHAPEHRLILDPLETVSLRADERETGVDCLSCHGQRQEGVAATRSIPNAPCRPTLEPMLSNSQACAACHVTIHKDWLASSYAAEGKTCQTCHMPKVDGRSGGRSHVCLGGHDDALVRSGVRMTSRQEGKEMLVEVTNHATGHNFPGERHNRTLLVQVIQRTAEGEITLAQQTLIKGITPFRGETSKEQIVAGKSFVARFPVVAPATTAQTRLLYKSFPWHSDREALIVHEVDLDLAAP